MKSTRQDVLDAASALSEEDRQWIIDMLELTITARNLAERDAAWEKEIVRRMKDFEEGRAESKSWEEVRDALLKRVAQ